MWLWPVLQNLQIHHSHQILTLGRVYSTYILKSGLPAADDIFYIGDFELKARIRNITRFDKRQAQLKNSVLDARVKKVPIDKHFQA